MPYTRGIKGIDAELARLGDYLDRQVDALGGGVSGQYQLAAVQRQVRVGPRRAVQGRCTRHCVLRCVGGSVSGQYQLAAVQRQVRVGTRNST